MKKITLLFITLTSYIGYSQAPTEAAPTPPARNAEDVKSIFSDAYAPITTFAYSGDTDSYNTGSSPASTALVSIAGNNTNVITGLGTGTDQISSFEGIDFQGGRFDASGFTGFHMDIWTSTATLDKSFNIKLSNWKGGAGEVNAIEYSGTNGSFLTNPNPGTWISIDVPLDDFTIAGGNLDRDDLVQLILTSNLGTVYYDNLYFYKGTALKAPSFKESNISMYPNPVKNSLNIEAKSNIKNISVYNVLGQKVIEKNPNKNLTSLNTGNLQSGVYIIKANIDGKISSSKFVKE